MSEMSPRFGHISQCTLKKPGMGMNDSIVIINGLILLANLGVLGLTIKLYTEYVKDRSQWQRKIGGQS
jgi:hypothetical protein